MLAKKEKKSGMTDPAQKTGKKKWKSLDILSPMKTRSFHVGGYSVAATAIVLAIVIVINMMVNELPASWTQYDITSNQLFTISNQTEKLVSGLEQDVTIYWVVQSGYEDTYVGNLLDRYEALSDHVKVVKKDPDVYPGFVQQYTETVENNSLIVECGERYRFISDSDIYVYDYSNYYYTGSYDVSFDGESAVTSAIDYVIREDLPKVYLLTGHGELDLSSTFTEAMSLANLETEEISLLTQDAVPEDADCVLIYCPQSDIAAEEQEMLLAYLQAGGSLFLITDPLEDNAHLTNLEILLAQYGVTASEGIVIEGNRQYYGLGMPYYLLPEIESHTITSPLNEEGYYVLLPIAQGLTVSDDLRDTVTVSELLTTSGSSFSKVAGYDLATYDKEDGDIDGPFALAVAITETVTAEDSDAAETGEEDTAATDGETNIVWVSSGALLDDDTNQRVSGGNQDFFLNALSWLCETEETSTISIHAKSLSYEYLTVDSAAASTLTILMIAVIPVAYLSVGVITWVRRKRR